MKRYISWVLVGVIGVVQAATARLGETPAECQRRYGEAVAKYPGHAGVAGVSVYVKDGLSVVAFFTKSPVKGTRAGVVIYSRLRPDVQRGSYATPKITDGEQRTLLETVPGRWKSYNAPPGLEGKPEGLKSISSRPSLLIKYRDATAKAVRRTVKTIYPANLDFWTGAPPENIAHNGSKTFAFRVARDRGVAICSYDATKAIAAWADRLVAEKQNAKKPQQQKLPGF